MNWRELGRASTAGCHNALLGGKDHRPADRKIAGVIEEILPNIGAAARESRKCSRRIVGHLAAACGLRQFVDIGAGFPFWPDVHEVAQLVDSRCRIVYVDHDPVVGVHRRARSVGHPRGAVDFVLGDLLTPSSILDAPELHDTLDLQEPVGLLLFNVLCYAAIGRRSVVPSDSTRT